MKVAGYIFFSKTQNSKFIWMLRFYWTELCWGAEPTFLPTGYSNYNEF